MNFRRKLRKLLTEQFCFFVCTRLPVLRHVLAAVGSASLLLLLPLVWRLAALLSREGCRCPKNCLHGSDDDGFDVTRFGWLTRLPQRDGDGTLLRHVVRWPDLSADG